MYFQVFDDCLITQMLAKLRTKGRISDYKTSNHLEKYCWQLVPIMVNGAQNLAGEFSIWILFLSVFIKMYSSHVLDVICSKQWPSYLFVVCSFQHLNVYNYSEILIICGVTIFCVNFLRQKTATSQIQILPNISCRFYLYEYPLKFTNILGPA